MWIFNDHDHFVDVDDDHDDDVNDDMIIVIKFS